LRHTVRLVAWANEEGVVAPPFTGSLAASGVGPDLGTVGLDGRSLGERIESGGGAPFEVGSAAWGPIAGYIELHIEQGPVLDRAGLDIGIVTGIIGCQRGSLSVTGHANHAGTTPMDMRNDALVAAAQIVLAVRELATSGPGAVQVATVGSLRVTPGNANVVPGGAEMSYDIRSLDDAACRSGLQLLDQAAARIAAETGTIVQRTPTLASAAVATDVRWRTAILAAAAACGFATAELASGAGHDAQHMARLGPVGMVFVPSIDGVSHSPAEATSPKHLVAGAEVLLGALRLADEVFPIAPAITPMASPGSP
jgi:hydantoinase/carbamoylase family amidase